MSHPIYSRQQLLNKKLPKVKQIAAELGVVPSGNKTFLVSWVDAIVEHQAAQVQKIQAVEATIDFESESFEGSTQPYMVLVGGEIVHRAASYQLAERYCKWHSLRLVDSQTLAQNELEAELEVQATARAEKAKSVQILEQVEDEGFVKFVVQSGDNLYTVTPAHPMNNQRCECGDSYFRGVECKHQIKVKEEIASKISFISPSDFGFYEAILDGDIHNVIATIDHESLGTWRVEMNGIKKPFASYQKAEDFIKEEYLKGVFMDERGSGRITITQPIEDMAINIEDINFRDDKGQQYSVKVCGVLAGYIWLNDLGWTLNGEDYQDDWRPVAKELIRLTKHEYLLAA
jgi:hypothetical protein